MTERKFTDEEVIKAFEFCVRNKDTCDGCPCVEGKFECVTNDPKFALDLINRQRGEIERLTVEIDAMRGAANSLKMHYANAKSEATKEFAERLKKRECSNAFCCWCVHADIYGHRAKECDEPYIDKNGKEQKACFAYAKFESYIDNFVKEFTEGKNNDTN